ncbi:potassium channel family protein [Synechococcus sp. CC9616]|uniref:potassium channel family protein n=1 Tax=Synechococcus sp. CC9616 TaxID=110663 RepID=UPI0004B5A067|nr:potassium channel family protein [Synechococcus sp. CC9616]
MIESRPPRPQSSGQLKLLLLLTLLLVGGLAFPALIRYKFLLYSLIALLLTQVMVRDVDTHAWANFVYRLLGAVAVVAMWLWLLTPLELIYSGVPLALSWGILLTWSIRRLIMQISREPVINESMLMGAVAGYLHLGLTAALIMSAVETIQPGSFAPLELSAEYLVKGSINVINVGDVFTQITYFAFVCLTTVGFGDIAPVLPLARMISVATSIVGPLYLAVVMGILIGRFVSTNGAGQSRSRP